jgi:type VI secretion system secreted protein Hcp
MKKQPMYLGLIACFLMFSSVKGIGQTSLQQVIGNISIEGTKQGDFNEGKKKETEIPIIGYSYTVQTPHDQASGMATGKRQYSPIMIVKNFDNASVQLFQAVTNNEVLKTVIIVLQKPDNGGKFSAFQTIKLTDAVIVKVSQFEGAGAPEKLVPNYMLMEEVSFLFQKIEIQNSNGKTTSTDDWQAMK